MVLEVEYGLFVYKATKALPIFDGPKAASPIHGKRVKDGTVVSACCLWNKMVQLEGGKGWARVRIITLGGRPRGPVWLPSCCCCGWGSGDV